MVRYVESIFSCNSSSEVLCILQEFLRDFAETGLSSQVPSELYPVRIRSIVEIKLWSMRARIALQQQAMERKAPHATLTSLETVLSAANRRIELLGS